MAKFNFGERRIPGYKKKVGAWECPRRSATPIVGEDIEVIARMFFVEQVPMADIAKHFKVGPTEIRKITTGNNFHQQWSAVIINLIAEGCPCVRDRSQLKEDKRAAAGTLRSEPLDAEMVLSIRRMHMDGFSLPDILAKTGLKIYRVRAILRNETFNEDKYKPQGWRMDTTDWRKDSE